MLSHECDFNYMLFSISNLQKHNRIAHQGQYQQGRLRNLREERRLNYHGPMQSWVFLWFQCIFLYFFKILFSHLSALMLASMATLSLNYSVHLNK